MTANNRALEKIAKCFALAESSNPYEAEAALRQARKLMEKHQLTEQDVATHEIRQYELKIGDAGREPPAWCIQLAEVCASAMHSLLVIRHGASGQYLIFVGLQDHADWAAYAWQVLHRQLKLARREYTSSLKRCRMATRRRRGDLFARAWIQAVRELITDFSGLDEPARKRLEQWRDEQFDSLRTFEPAESKVSTRDHTAIRAGFSAGRRARLHRPVTGNAAMAQLAREGY